MAKKKSELTDEQKEDIVITEDLIGPQLDSALGPDAEFVWAPNPDEPRHAVSFSLPRGVLVALLDPSHEMADTEGALRLGLLGAGGTLSPIGKLVVAGFDQIPVRHKMNAAQRAARNREVDNS